MEGSALTTIWLREVRPPMETANDTVSCPEVEVGNGGTEDVQGDEERRMQNGSDHCNSEEVVGTVVVPREGNAVVQGAEGMRMRNDSDDFNGVEIVGTVVEPKEGMSFATLQDVINMYQRYAISKGFHVIRSSRSKDRNGVFKFQTIACHGARQPTTSSGVNGLKRRPSRRKNCKARVCCSLGDDGRWKINTVELNHTHPISPSMTMFLPRHRETPKNMKRQLNGNDIVEIRPNKSIREVVSEGGTCEGLSCWPKDYMKNIEVGNSERLGDGDAEAVYKMILRMKQTSRDFAYDIELYDDGRMRNVVWVDRRSKAAYKYFSDVVCFDSTYLFRKHRMPVAPFFGVNHHGQPILLGCAIISDDETSTYEWVLDTWLRYMGNEVPNAVITDQCSSMEHAIEKVLPNAKHKFCIWDIVSRFPDKLRDHDKYTELKEDFLQAVYDPLSPEEFDGRWTAMVHKHGLENNQWIYDLYEKREKWVPIFVKDGFWAGIVSAQRNESTNAFFDGYFNLWSSLKQFVEQYEVGMREKIENEITEDHKSLISTYPCVTEFGIEQQFQQVYTNKMFLKVQTEIVRQIYCEVEVDVDNGLIVIYSVKERRTISEGGPIRRHFKVEYNVEHQQVSCNCRMFEFEGVVCRHVFKVLVHRDLDEIPQCYILDRWRKDLQRCHTTMGIGCVGDDMSLERRQMQSLEKEFYKGADIACESTQKCEFFLRWIQQGVRRLENWTDNWDEQQGVNICHRDLSQDVAKLVGDTSQGRQ